MRPIALFPSDYFDGKIADAMLQKEYDACRETGLFEPVLFNYEKWFCDNRLSLSFTPEKETEAVYRGWMMLPEKYADFYARLLRKNIRLVTTPEQYSLMHLFPNIRPAFGDDTPEIMVFPAGTEVDLLQIRRRFDRFMVKDYVKSVKGTEFPAFFSSDVDDETFYKWLDIFYDYRGELFTGGICIKEYAELKKYDGHTNEYRAFYAGGEIVSVCKNGGQTVLTPDPPRRMIEKYRNLNSPFYTVDYAELADGGWKVLEAGDGSVSGLSDGQDAAAFFRALYFALWYKSETTVWDGMPADEKQKIGISGMVKLILDQFPEQAAVLEEATDLQGNVLGHTFASLAISQPMEACFFNDQKKFEKYCYMIEQLWRNGDDDVLNIVNVTILEDLNSFEDPAIWKGAGEFFGDSFKKYINGDMIQMI